MKWKIIPYRKRKDIHCGETSAAVSVGNRNDFIFSVPAQATV